MNAYGVPADALAASRHLAWRLAVGGREDRALTILRGNVSLDPRDRWSHVLLAELSLRRGDVPSALKHASSAVELARDAEGAFVLSRALLAAGRKEEARSWLEQTAHLADQSEPGIASAARVISRRLA